MGMVVRIKDKALSIEGNTYTQDFSYIRRFLPDRVFFDIENGARGLRFGERVEEIRLRVGRSICFTLGGGSRSNLELGSAVFESELGEILRRMCKGSLYAYSESIAKGYISLGNGVRVGVCGQAASECGRITGVFGISSLNIRLPLFEAPADTAVLAKVKRAVFLGKGALIYSPPGGGKTTLLRSLINDLSKPPHDLRIAVVDTREELFSGNPPRGMLDILSGYPMAEGIRTAAAFMNPQLIACDELSDTEADAVIRAQNCGAPLLATAHSDSLQRLLHKHGIDRMHREGVFEVYIGIKRKCGRFCYEIHSCAEVGNEAFRLISSGD